MKIISIMSAPIVLKNTGRAKTMGEGLKKPASLKDLSSAFTPCPGIIYDLLKDRERKQKSDK